MTAKNYETYTVPDSEVEKLRARLSKAEELLVDALWYVKQFNRKESDLECRRSIEDFLTSTNAGEKSNNNQK